jgi:hypothetical protein
MTEPESPPPRRRTAALPTFHQPTDPPDPIPSPSDPLPWPSGDPVDGSGDVSRDLPIPRPVPSDTPTATSATSDVDPKLLVGLVAAVVGLVVSAAAVVVKRSRPGRVFRAPDKKQIRAFAEPVTKILTAHMEITRLHPSLVHGVEATAVVGQYLEEGPLTVPARATADAAGIPADIQEPQP